MDHASTPYVPDAPRMPPASGTLTLADVRPGDTVRVRTIPPHVREALAGLGVHEGDWIRCESIDRYVVVRTVDGCVPFERGLVAAVEVTPAEPLADRADPDDELPARTHQRAR